MSQFISSLLKSVTLASLALACAHHLPSAPKAPQRSVATATEKNMFIYRLMVYAETKTETVIDVFADGEQMASVISTPEKKQNAFCLMINQEVNQITFKPKSKFEGSIGYAIKDSCDAD